MTLCVLLLEGCQTDGVDQRKEELCRLLFASGAEVALGDSVVLLADGLPINERLDVLLEAIRGVYVNNSSRQQDSWIAEAERIAPKERQVEVEMERLRGSYLVAYKNKDSLVLEKVREKFHQLRESHHLSKRQQVWFLYYKVKIDGDVNLLDSWMDMTQALRYVRRLDDPMLNIRILECFSELALKGGDHVRAVALMKDAYQIREKEGLPLNKKRFLRWMIACLFQYGTNAEVLECLKELREEMRKSSDRMGEKTVLKKIAETYSEKGRLPEALKAFKEADDIPGGLFYHAEIAGRLAQVFERLGLSDSATVYYEQSVKGWQGLGGKLVPPGAIPVYSDYARVLWKDGKPGRALELLRLAVADVPNYGRLDGEVGDVYLLPYLEALLQLGRYYHEQGDTRLALRMLFRRDSLRDRYVASDSWYKRMQLAEQYRNQELKAKLALQEELLAARRWGLVMMSLLCVVLVGALLMLWKLYRQKRRRLDDIYRKQKELERLEYQMMAERPQNSSEAVLFSRLEKIVIEERLFQNPDLSLEDLCPVVGSNRSYVSACVNKEAGMNFSGWLNKIRVSYVLKEIENGKDDLTELYVHAGFASSTSFYRNFKQQIQMTPKQYIERERRKMIK